MFLFIGVIFALIGVLMTVRPNIVYQITESWKSSTPGEPSKLFLFSTRFGGVLFIVVGIASIIVQFID